MLKKHYPALLKIFLLAGILAISDFICGFALKYFYFNAPYKVTYSLNETNEDILIFGSSRANHHYDPNVFTEVLNQTCFNNGYDGQSIYYHTAILESTLTRYKPQTIILDITGWDYGISANNSATDALNVFLPYYASAKEEIREIINLRGKYEKVKLLSKCYPYNSRILSIIDCYTNQRNRSFGDKGYLPLQGVIKGEITVRNHEGEQEYDQQKVSYLEQFIAKARAADVNMIITFSPTLNAPNTQLISSLANKHNVEFWDYSNNPSFLKPEYLKDRTHMNSNGAEKYSREIA